MAGNNSIGKASLILTANSTQFDKGLDKAAKDVKQKVGGINDTLKQAFSGAFLGGFGGQVLGQLGGKITAGISEALERGLIEIGDAAKRLVGIRKQISEEEKAQVVLDMQEKRLKVLETTQQAYQRVRDTLEEMTKATRRLGMSQKELELDKFADSLSLKNSGRFTKEQIEQNTKAFAKQQDLFEKRKEDIEDAKKFWDKLGKSVSDYVNNLKAAVALNEEFATPAERFAKAMEKVEKLRDAGVLSAGIFEKKRQQLTDQIFGKQEFRFAPGDQAGSREAGEAIIRARFAERSGAPGSDPAKETPKKIEKTNEILDQINGRDEKLYQEIKQRQAGPIVVTVHDF